MRQLLRNTYFVPSIFFALLFLLYFPSLRSGAYIDDNQLIFSNDFIRNVHNPLQFWYRGQMNTKAWPLTHTVYWLLFQAFQKNFIPYRMVLLLLHWINGCILFFSLRKKSFGAAVFAATLFWFSPVAVEAVTWISQIGTLLCTLFFALWMKCFFEKKVPSIYESNLLLIGMMLSKSFAFFLVPIEIIKNRESLGWRRSFLHSLPALLFSFYSAFLVSYGVYGYQTEIYHSQNYFQANPVAPPIVNAPPVEAPKPQINKALPTKKHPKKQKLLTKSAGPAPASTSETEWVHKSDETYLKYHFFQSPKEMIGKLEVEGRTFLYYSVRLLSFYELSVSNVRNWVQWNWLFFLCSLFSFALFCFCLWRKHWAFALAFATYIPISGLFYVPFMKQYLVADRVIYLPFFALAWCLGDIFHVLENKLLRRACYFWPVLFAVITFFVVLQPRVELVVP